MLKLGPPEDMFQYPVLLDWLQYILIDTHKVYMCTQPFSGCMHMYIDMCMPDVYIQTVCLIKPFAILL